MTTTRFWRGAGAACVAAVTLALCGCGVPAPSAGSIVAIGHSGLTGYASDDSYTDVGENSWATGTNPEVDSIYSRMLESTPGLTAYNFAIDGSDVDSLLDTQIDEALAVDEPPALIIVQSIDNDIRCDGSDEENLGPYGEKFTEVLSRLTAGAPDAHILVVSQWADVATYADVMAAIAPSAIAGYGPCDLVDPTTSQVLPDRVASLQALVDDYQAVVADACATFDACVWDDGAAQRLQLEATDLGPDYNHLSVAGHRKLAELEWAVIEPVLG